MKRLIVISLVVLRVKAFVGYQSFSRSTPSYLAHSFQEEEEFELPDWAALDPPCDTDSVEELFLGEDDFVSLDLENSESSSQRICASVVYQDPAIIEPLFWVEPRLATVEANGGTLEVTVKSIENEDEDDAFRIPTCWLLLTTEAGEAWYYKLMQTSEACA